MLQIKQSAAKAICLKACNEIMCGVPQGSILGPLFTFMYADDSTVNTSDKTISQIKAK